MKKLALAGMAAVLLGTSVSSFAYDQGDMLLRVGVTSYDFSKDLKTDEQLGVEFAYILTGTLGIGQMGIEASTAMPIDLKDDKGNKTADALPLTVVVQYYFNTGSIVTPYVGAGINYTLMNAKAGGDNLDDSIGLVVQAGADFAINDNWGVNVNLRKIEMDATGDIGVAKFDESINPLVVSVSGSYKF